MIEASILWNAALTIVIGLVGWAVKQKDKEMDEIKAEASRVTILLNRTREEIAKEYVTKVDVHNDINRVLDSLNRLDAKIDTFIREQKSALS